MTASTTFAARCQDRREDPALERMTKQLEEDAVRAPPDCLAEARLNF